jgi:hypothetical protein
LEVGTKSPSFILVLMILASVMFSACTRPPNLTARQCQELCVRDGRAMKTYRVGTAIPIIKRSPTVHCECESRLEN